MKDMMQRLFNIWNVIAEPWQMLIQEFLTPGKCKLLQLCFVHWAGWNNFLYFKKWLHVGNSSITRLSRGHLFVHESLELQILSLPTWKPA